MKKDRDSISVIEKYLKENANMGDEKLKDFYVKEMSKVWKVFNETERNINDFIILEKNIQELEKDMMEKIYKKRLKNIRTLYNKVMGIKITRRFNGVR